MYSRPNIPPPLSLGANGESQLVRCNAAMASSAIAIVTPRPKSSPANRSGQKSVLTALPPPPPLATAGRAEDDLNAARLLTSVASIVSNEISVHRDCISGAQRAPEMPILPPHSLIQRTRSVSIDSFALSHAPRSTPPPSCVNGDVGQDSLETAAMANPSDLFSTFVAVPTIISPPPSPAAPPRNHSATYKAKRVRVQIGGPRQLAQRKQQQQRRRQQHTASTAGCRHRGTVAAASDVLPVHRGIVQRTEALKPRSDGTLRIILRKKFSWKNHPELEAFLVANRDEYLKHSALNYTVQQKRYNNELTDRLLNLSSQHGYVFDETEFTFVTVRDRIRCYFKVG